MSKLPRNFLTLNLKGYGLFEVWWSHENGMSYPVHINGHALKFIDRKKAEEFAIDLAKDNLDSEHATKFFKVVTAQDVA